MAIFSCTVSLYSQNGIRIDKFNIGTAFTCISVDTNTNVWAGTMKTGLFFLNKRADTSLKSFSQLPANGTIDLSKNGIQTLASDKIGNVWVGHNGAGGTTAMGGGVERIDINNLGNDKHFSTS